MNTYYFKDSTGVSVGTREKRLQNGCTRRQHEKGH